jgi:lysozyme family protein
MKENFGKALRLLLKHEGGYVNHPDDPGGITNLGVTKRVYEEWIGREATEEDMENLTPEDVAPLYKTNYWDKCRCDDLPSGLDYVAFDWAVNSGVSRSSKGIQKSCGAEPDGIIGLKTLELAKEQNTTFMIENFQIIRQEFYEKLDHFDTFGRGWTRRNNEATKVALEMVKK